MPSKSNIQKVKELKDHLSKAKAIYFTEFHGLNVGEITRLRSEFFKANIDYRVEKNTLIKLAAKESNISGVDDFLTGSTAMAISYDEPVSPAKIIKEFTKNSDLPNVKGILFDGEVISGEEFKRIANLPSKEELLSKFVAMLNSPMQKFVSTLNAPMQNIVGVLNSLKENKS